MAPTRSHRLAPALAVSILAVLLGASSALFGVCGPFADVSDAAFCPFVLEMFTLGITTGTTPTTYDPASAVSRLQMAAFLSRSVDGVLKRGGRRAVLGKFATARGGTLLGQTGLGSTPTFIACDGADVWVSNFLGSSVSRVRGSDGRALETWTGASSAQGILAEMGRILVTGDETPGKLYMIDPSQPAGVVTTVASNLAQFPKGIAFDGVRIWTANSSGSVSIVTPAAGIPWTVTTVAAGFSSPIGAVFDGAFVWVTDTTRLVKLDSAGALLMSVTIGANGNAPLFDGANIWVPSSPDSSITVVRTSNGAILRTLTGNGLAFPRSAAFDGERILVTNYSGDTVSLWKAADLTPLGVLDAGSGSSPRSACSDGINFWVVLQGPERLARF